MTELIDKSGRAVGEAAIEVLRSSFRGQLIRPGDSAYEDARRIWNASIERRPGLIARCSGTADVIDAVRFARDNDLLVAIRGGGHNVGGRALCDAGLVIDLSRMTGVHVDPRRETARVQGGATLGDLDRETHVHGMAVPSGIVSRTGIGGLTLGGGVGWLVRKYGLTCDNLLSCDVVTAEGRLLTASDEENPDLFWALRGGGGNFGVAVSFEFRTRPVRFVLGGMIVHPRDQAEPLLRFYRDLTREAPDELTAYAAFLCTPDQIPVVAVLACYTGDLDEGEGVLAPLRQFGAPLVDGIEEIPFPVMQTLLDDSAPDGNHNYWKSSFIGELSDDAIGVLVESAEAATSPLTAIVIEQMGGAASRVAPGETAFAHRHETIDVGILTQWTEGADSERHIQWTVDLADRLRPFGTGAYLLNFLGGEDEAAVRAAFGANYDRLVEMKNRYDPTNFFRMNQNIKPAV